MQTLVVDSNGVVKKLEQKGFSRSQAEGVTQVLNELDLSNLATKADLIGVEHSLKLDMRNLQVSMIKWVAGMLIAQGAAIVALIEFFK